MTDFVANHARHYQTTTRPGEILQEYGTTTSGPQLPQKIETKQQRRYRNSKKNGRRSGQMEKSSKQDNQH